MISNERCCYAKEFLEKKLNYEHGDCLSYKVDISALKEGNFSFNHASCQCCAPSFQLDEYVNMRSYPYLNHIHVVVIKEQDKMNFITCYGGIVAL